MRTRLVACFQSCSVGTLVRRTMKREKDPSERMFGMKVLPFIAYVLVRTHGKKRWKNQRPRANRWRGCSLGWWSTFSHKYRQVFWKVHSCLCTSCDYIFQFWRHVSFDKFILLRFISVSVALRSELLELTKEDFDRYIKFDYPDIYKCMTEMGEAKLKAQGIW